MSFGNSSTKEFQSKMLQSTRALSQSEDRRLSLNEDRQRESTSLTHGLLKSMLLTFHTY